MLTQSKLYLVLTLPIKKLLITNAAYCLQAQYVFIHDALNELVVCGETDIPVANIRTTINRLQKLVIGEAITGFLKQFQVIACGVYIASVAR